MKELNQAQLENISGGNWGAIGAFTTVFTLPASISDSANTYAGWGSGISQAYWDYSYPYDPNSSGCYGPGC